MPSQPTTPPHTISRPTTVKDAPISFGLLAMSRAFHGYGAELLNRLALHPGQELILMQLFDRDGQTQTDLQHALGLDHSTVSRAIKRMQDGGLLTRTTSDDDRRAKIVTLTSRGIALREPLQQLWNELEQHALDVIAAGRRSGFVETIAMLEQTYTSARRSGSHR